MLNEPSDKFKVLYATVLAVAMSACSNSASDKANNLYESASESVESGNYTNAIALLDSIDSLYPGEVEVRRNGMYLRAKAIEGQTLKDLQTNDSLSVIAKTDAENLKSVMTFVSNPVEGYYIASSQKDVAVESTEGLHARISPDGVFYLISSAKGGTKSLGVMLSAGGEEARSATVQPDGERNDRSRGSEIITFTQAECDTLGRFALSHIGQPVKLTFVGATYRSITMTKPQLDALAEVYSASVVFSRLRLLQMQKNKLEQQLTISRSQQARTFKDSDK